MKQVALRLADDLAARIDSARGETSREQWIRDAIQRALPAVSTAPRPAPPSQRTREEAVRIRDEKARAILDRRMGR
jgi:hypothetical protein